MPNLDHTIRRATAGTTVTVGLAAVVLSWTGLQQLAVESGYGRSAFLLPLVIDGLWIASSLQIVHAAVARSLAWPAWVLVMIGIAISVAGNASTATSTQDRLVHAIPPLAAAACLEMLVSSLRRRVVDEHTEAQRLAEEQARVDAVAARAERSANRPATSARTRATPNAKAPTATRQPSTPLTPELRKEIYALRDERDERGKPKPYRAISEALGIDKNKVMEAITTREKEAA